MKKITQKYTDPGKWEERIIFDKVGGEKVWEGAIDARRGGDYELLVVAEHRARDTRGRLTVRVVAGEGARVKVKGIISIEKKGQGTEDFLELRALVLNEKAQVTLDPELEIEANQVKASHAASVGGIDPEQLLYLKSRGLTTEQAVQTIVEGWLGV